MQAAKDMNRIGRITDDLGRVAQRITNVENNLFHSPQVRIEPPPLPPILSDALAPDPIDLSVPTGAELPKSRRLNVGGDVLPEVDVSRHVIRIKNKSGE